MIKYKNSRDLASQQNKHLTRRQDRGKLCIVIFFPNFAHSTLPPVPCRGAGDPTPKSAWTSTSFCMGHRHHYRTTKFPPSHNKKTLEHTPNCRQPTGMTYRNSPSFFFFFFFFLLRYHEHNLPLCARFSDNTIGIYVTTLTGVTI